jgi:hypothetical protein
MPVSPIRRAINRRIPLTGLGWTALAFILAALAIASGVFLRGL